MVVSCVYGEQQERGGEGREEDEVGGQQEGGGHQGGGHQGSGQQ